MFDLFKIGFLSFSFLDLIDVVIVTFIVYRLYLILRGTIAARIFVGLITILVLSFLAQVINLRALAWLLKLLSDSWIIAFIILFQPEIRRLLLLVGENPFLRRIFLKSAGKDIVDILVETAFDLSSMQYGALIVLIKSTGIKTIVESGEILNAKMSKNLIKSIFYPRSPLHDGAVIVKSNVVEAARCTLPLSPVTMADGHPLGMRHRAGLGITEQVDVLSLIVSEETGSISVAENGTLKRGLSKEELRRILARALKSPNDN